MDFTKIIVSIVTVFIAGLLALQYKNFKAWLLWGVSQAEEYFGNGTGELKLHYVYNLAVDRYPVFAKIIPFNHFKRLVDIALVQMRVWIENNTQIASILMQDMK